MKHALLFSAVVLLAGCGGSPSPPATDWVVGQWQMVRAEVWTQSVEWSGGMTFSANGDWSGWRDGPGGRVEDSGQWVALSPGNYSIDSAVWPRVYRFGDTGELIAAINNGDTMDVFYFARPDDSQRHGFFWGQVEPRL